MDTVTNSNTNMSTHVEHTELTELRKEDNVLSPVLGMKDEKSSSAKNLHKRKRRYRNLPKQLLYSLDESGFKLKTHQKYGVNWMISKELQNKKSLYNVSGGLLCDEPGMGKTIQTATMMLANKLDKTLIILPPNLMDQWEDTLSRILPDSKIRRHYKNKIFASESELQNCDNDIIITSMYSLKDVSVLHTIRWGRVIFDEVDKIRNSTCKIGKACCLLKSNIKWGLTGTPIQNSEKDFLQLFKFIRSNTEYESYQDVRPCKKGLCKFAITSMMRRVKSEIPELKQLDSNIEYHNVECLFISEDEKTIYKDIRDNLIQKLRAIMELQGHNTHGGNINMMMMTIFLRLRQTSIHPHIAINAMDEHNKVFKNFNTPSSKYTKMLEIVEGKVQLGEKTIIFCNFKEEMQNISELLTENNILNELYNGSMSPAEKITVLNSFIDQKYLYLNMLRIGQQYSSDIPLECIKNISKFLPQVLIIQIKSGGVGLNLQQFNNIIFTIPDWNPANEIQAIARAHRMGQKRKVNVYNLILTDTEFDTIDQRILFIERSKNEIIDTFYTNSGKKKHTPSPTANDLQKLIL